VKGTEWIRGYTGSVRKPTILLAVGDVAPCRSQPASMFAGVSSLLHTGDLVFGQLESTLSTRGSPLPQARLAMRSHPDSAQAIRDAGFDVMSVAGNHCMDWGADALSDTLQHARAAGLSVCGAGDDIESARAPALMEVGGVRFAFLAYSSVLPQGYWAEQRRPGCAPMRAYTHYEQIEHDQPGTPPRVHTFAHREDLTALERDVRAARAQADFVAVSMHWGIHFVPVEIADYQREVAYAAVNAGADVILGHHPHILKGIEFYRGKPIFYSLGNFAIEQPMEFASGVLGSRSFHELSALNSAFQPASKYISPPDTQKTLIAKLSITSASTADVAFVPAIINDDAEPSVLSPHDARFAEVVSYVENVTRAQGFATGFEVRGGEVLIHPLSVTSGE
jgi:poly-gamma-glutamate capsule biosynthesis protein CapA/YwtB (metallophosphatase superfamily)